MYVCAYLSGVALIHQLLSNLRSGSSVVPKINALPKISAAQSRVSSGRSSASSAKQHYMSRSRYIPGQ